MTMPSPRSLSAMFADPYIADAFRRAEREPGSAFAVPAPRPVTLAGGAAVRPPDEAGAPSGAFDQNLQRLCAAANLAYGLAISPMPIPALLQGASGGADPHLGRDLLDVVIDGCEIGQAVVELLAAIRRSLEGAVR
jgi:hypothetical protein